MTEKEGRPPGIYRRLARILEGEKETRDETRPLFYHVDNILPDNAPYKDVVRCVKILEQFRNGVYPLAIPDLIPFLQTQTEDVQNVFLYYGSFIRKEK